MRHPVGLRETLSTLLALGVVALCLRARAEDAPTADAAKIDPEVKQVQDTPVELPPVPPPTPPSPPSTMPRSMGNLPPSAEAPRASALAAQAGGADIVAGAAASVVNATDLSALLSRSPGGVGVDIQQRNALGGEARIRGYHFGQVLTDGDGGYFFPTRLDLDTAVNKFDPRSVSDIVIIKGPYSVRFGPGFSFIDIATYDTPRHEEGFKAQARSAVGYQVNGERQSVLQTIQGGDRDWGFRASYDFRVGNDYQAGDGRDVPSSYNSQNFNYAVGYSFSPDHRIELKGLRLVLQNVEFPGNYFDISRLDTEAYSLRYTLDNQRFWDRLHVDLWYNNTGASGDTNQGAKQAFLTSFLSGPVIFNRPPGANILDFSTTAFSGSSRGYRAVMGWGDKDCWQVAAGTDFNDVRNRLTENIRLLQTGFQDPNLGFPDPFLRQNLSIPPSQLLDPGVFLDATLPINKLLTFNAGARADFVSTTSQNRVVNGNIIVTPGAQTNPSVPGQIPTDGGAQAAITSFDPILFSVKPFANDLSRHFDTWAAYATADYKIDEHLTTFAKFGYAERPPFITELYAAGPFIAVLQQGLNRLIGDPNLKEEKLHQVDVGLRADYSVFRAGATGFYAWIDDYITFDQNRIGGSQLSQVIFTNTDLATLAGGEMFAEVELTENVTPFLTVSYVQGRDLTHIDNRRPATLVSSRRTFDTEPLPRIPPLEVRSGFRLHEAVLRPRWSVEFQARCVWGQNLVATSLSELPTSGFTTFDARAFWQVNEGLLVSGGVENIGDKFYREHLDRRAGDLLFRPGTNIYLAAELSY